MKDDKNKVGHRIFMCATVLFLAALFIRLEYRSALVIDTPVSGDAYYYLSYAYNMIKYNVFAKEPTFNSDKIPTPDSFWAPGFPFLLSSAIRIGGLSDAGFYHVATLYNAVLGALIVPMIFYLCLQFLPISFSFAISLITAFSPHLLSIGSYILTETLFSFLLITSFFFFAIAAKNKSTPFFFLSGLIMGLAYLTNPVILFFPFLIFPALFVLRRKSLHLKETKTFLVRTFVYLSIYILVVGAWGIRNHYSVKNDSNSSDGRAAMCIIIGSHPEYYDDFAKGLTKDPNYQVNKDITDASDSLKRALLVVKNKLIENPLRYTIWYLVRKPLMYWSWDIKIGYGDVYVLAVNQSLFTVSKIWSSIKSIYKFINPIMFFVNLYGGWLILKAIKRQDKDCAEIGIVFLLILYSTAMHVVFHSDPRYSLPFRPAFYILFVWSLYSLKKIIIDFYAIKSNQYRKY